MSIRGAKSPQRDTEQPHRDTGRPHSDREETQNDHGRHRMTTQVTNDHEMITKRRCLHHKNETESKTTSLCSDTITIIHVIPETLKAFEVNTFIL